METSIISIISAVIFGLISVIWQDARNRFRSHDLKIESIVQKQAEMTERCAQHNQITIEQIRTIMQDELRKFELSLLNEGKITLKPKRTKKGE